MTGDRAISAPEPKKRMWRDVGVQGDISVELSVCGLTGGEPVDVKEEELVGGMLLYAVRASPPLHPPKRIHHLSQYKP